MKIDYYRVRLMLDSLLETPIKASKKTISDLKKRFQGEKLIAILLNEAEALVRHWAGEICDDDLLRFFGLSLEDLLALTKEFFDFDLKYFVYFPPISFFNYIGWMRKVERYIRSISSELINIAEEIFGFKMNLNFLFDYRVLSDRTAASSGEDIVVYGGLLGGYVEDKDFGKKIPKNMIKGVLAHEVFHSFFAKFLGEKEHLYKTRLGSLYYYHEFIADIGKFLVTSENYWIYELKKAITEIFTNSLGILVKNNLKEAVKIAKEYNPDLAEKISKGKYLLLRGEVAMNVFQIIRPLMSLYAFTFFKNPKNCIGPYSIFRLINIKKPIDLLFEVIGYLKRKLKEGENFVSF